MRRRALVVVAWLGLIAAIQLAWHFHNPYFAFVEVLGCDVAGVATWLLLRERATSSLLPRRTRIALAASRFVALVGLSRAGFFFVVYGLTTTENLFIFHRRWLDEGRELPFDQNWEISTSNLSLRAAVIFVFMLVGFELLRRETSRVRAGGEREPLRRALLMNLLGVAIALWQMTPRQLVDDGDAYHRAGMVLPLVPELSLVTEGWRVDFFGALAGLVVLLVLLAARVATGSDPPSIDHVRAALKVAAVWVVVLAVTHGAMLARLPHYDIIFILGFDGGVLATWLLVRDRTPSPSHLSRRSRIALTAARTLGLAGMSRAPLFFVSHTLLPVVAVYRFRAEFEHAGHELSNAQYWQMATSFMSPSAVVIVAAMMAAFALVRWEGNRVRAGGAREPLQRALFINLVIVGVALWQVVDHLHDSDETDSRFELPFALVPELSLVSADVQAIGAIIACAIAISILAAAFLAIGSDRPPSSMGRPASEDDGIAALDLEREDDRLFVGDGIGRMQLPAP